MRVVFIEPAAPGFHVYSFIKQLRLGLPLLGAILQERGHEARVYVESLADVDWDDVLSATVESVESLTVGDPGSDDEIGMGPVISAEQQERVLGFLERATDAKATIVTGGEAIGDRGLFVKPTIVTDVDQQAEIVQNEVFGPVITMQSAASDDAAIEMANDVRYGLAASVFSQNVGRAMKVAARLDFGTVWVNEHLFPLTSEMPHGGFKESGYGKDMSIYSMEEYTRIKHVCVKLAE